MEDLRYFDPVLEPGGTAVLVLARRIAEEVGTVAGKSIQVLGWSGPVIHRDWEYLVEMDGRTGVLAVAEADIRSFHNADYDPADLERYIRAQMRTLAEGPRGG